MRHVLSALVQNRPGVLAHISNMLASRGFNIDSLAVGETEHHDLSRMTFVVHGDDNVLDQVRKQLDKIVTVVRVDDISSENFVERDLMLIKVGCSAAAAARSLPARRELSRPGCGHPAQERDDRDQRHRGEGRGVHRTDATVRHPRTCPDRADRDGPRRGEAECRGGRDVTYLRRTIVLPTRRLDTVAGGTASIAEARRQDPHCPDGPGRFAKWDTTEPTARFAGSRTSNTGITTERVNDDDLVVPVVQFTKSNGELSSINIDEHVVVEKL